MGFGSNVGKNGGQKVIGAQSQKQSQRPTQRGIGAPSRSISKHGGKSNFSKGGVNESNFNKKSGKGNGYKSGKGKGSGSEWAEQWLVVPWHEWFRDVGCCVYKYITQEELLLSDGDLHHKYGADVKIDREAHFVGISGLLPLVPGAHIMSTRSTADV